MDNLTKNRRDELLEELKNKFKALPIMTIYAEDTSVLINFQQFLICGVNVEEEGYKIFNVSAEWKDQTSYQCNKAEDDTYYYYLESIDECLGETWRLVMFEGQKGQSKPHTSELSKYVTIDIFKDVYSNFIARADQNVELKKEKKKVKLNQVPYPFPEVQIYNGEKFKVQFGVGSPSASPYINWWVVSIYYETANGNITMGIEENRYPKLQQMTIKPIRYSFVGNKKEKVAVFYSSTKSAINLDELYEKFITVCEEVMRLSSK